MSNPIMQFFAYSHLSPEPVTGLAVSLREVSAEVADVASWMDGNLKDSPEKTAGLRKLLEAKDCFVRAAMFKASAPDVRG